MPSAPPTALPLQERSFWRFFIPSLAGALVFLLPVKSGESYTIPLGVLVELANEAIGDGRPWLVLGILTLSAILTPMISWGRLQLIDHRHPWRPIFDVSSPWVTLRIAGAACAWMVHLELGPAWIWHASTGGVALYQLAAGIVTLFFFAAFLLPLLTDFGFMEFVGVACRNIFRRLFGLPGRAAVDAVASWLAAAAVGILITSQQYRRGFYTARESAVIATNFSITSLPFCLFTTEFIGLGHMFLTVYTCVFLLGIVAAVIVPRLHPLSKIPDSYVTGSGADTTEVLPESSLFRHAILEASKRGALGPTPAQLLRGAVGNVMDIWFGLLPAVVLVGTVGLTLAEFTPLMQWIAWPFVFILEWLRLPEADLAAPAMVVGFLEMFLPAVLGQAVESEMTRFVICCVGLTQLIYMSEVGVLLIKSPIPLGFWNLLQIFFLRTLIVLPLSAAAAHLIF